MDEIQKYEDDLKNAIKRTNHLIENVVKPISFIHQDPNAPKAIQQLNKNSLISENTIIGYIGNLEYLERLKEQGDQNYSRNFTFTVNNQDKLNGNYFLNYSMDIISDMLCHGRLSTINKKLALYLLDNLKDTVYKSNCNYGYAYSVYGDNLIHELICTLYSDIIFIINRAIDLDCKCLGYILEKESVQNVYNSLDKESREYVSKEIDDSLYIIKNFYKNIINGDIYLFPVVMLDFLKSMQEFDRDIYAPLKPAKYEHYNTDF